MRQLKISKQITHRNEESIGRYLHEISRFTMISAEEEVELSMRIRKGDEIALEKLIVSNLRFVISVAKQYQNQGLSFPDLINEGNLGLVKAARRFDETRGFKFISYAVWWIRQSIFQAISEQTRIVRLPLNKLSSINKIKKAIPHLEQELEREPTDSEIAGYLDLTNEEVKVANAIKKNQVSFDNPVSPNGETENTLYDFVQTGDIPAPDNNLMQESTVTNINRALEKLSKTEATVLIMTFGLCGSPLCSMNETALRFDMTSERIRQIRNNGLIKLKHLLKGSPSFVEY